MRYSIILLVLTIFACKSEPTNKPAVLKEKVVSNIIGTIQNPNYPNIILESNGEQYQALIQNGRFSFKLMLDEPKIYNIRYGRRSGQIYIMPGDQVVFNTSANAFAQQMQFSGTRAAENNYLTSKVNEDIQEKSLKVKTYKLEEPDFISAVEASKQEKNKALQEFAVQHPTLDPYFKFVMETEIDYEWATDRLIYPLYHEFYTRKENFDVSPVYYDFLRTIDKDDPEKLLSTNYNAFLSNYLDLEAKKSIENNPELNLTANGTALEKFNIIEANFKSDEIKEYLMYNTLKSHIRYEGANGTSTLMARFQEVSENENYQKDIEQDFSVWRGLEEGQPAPTFAYTDIEGTVHDIADLKGKVVYVDVWATWCGPCKKELPHLEELQEDFKGNDKIVFTSVSIDKDKSAWERMVKDKEMKGLQLFAEGEWRSSIVKDYKITGIPRFLLIGPDGKIVSANAPRPSSERIKSELERLVKNS